MVVERAFGLDTAKHLSLFGRYPNWLAIPDRYWTWGIGGVFDGLRLIRKYRPEVIWSTYPIATAHVIASRLHRMTKLPWIADFRDSMTEEGFPEDPTRWRAYRKIEKFAVEHAHTSVFTTEGTRALYHGRYPEVTPDHWTVIANGFDEGNFIDAEQVIVRPSTARPTTLIHAGTLYPSERNPQQFFEAIHSLKSSGAISAKDLRIVLRATTCDDEYRPILRRLSIEDIVALEPPLPYRNALAEMLSADGLLLFQASNCNHQVPAKLYEYFRAGRPILALTDPIGDTAKELRSLGVGSIARLDDVSDIRNTLSTFLARVRTGAETGASRAQAARYSRRDGAAQLAQVLEQATLTAPRNA
jgi:glycosyltransferase involved in cell wall biosynthesis